MITTDSIVECGTEGAMCSAARRVTISGSTLALKYSRRGVSEKECDPTAVSIVRRWMKRNWSYRYAIHEERNALPRKVKTTRKNYSTSAVSIVRESVIWPSAHPH